MGQITRLSGGWRAVVLTVWAAAGAAVAHADAITEPLGYPHHQIHNFGINFNDTSTNNTRAQRHAVEMGYFAVTKWKSNDAAVANLQKTFLANVGSAGITIQVLNQGTGNETVQVRYNRHWGGDGQNNTLAAVFGITRANEGPWTNITASDLAFIQRYGAAKSAGWNTLSITSHTLGSDIFSHFYAGNTSLNGTTGTFTPYGNWSSVDVVNDAIKAGTTGFATTAGFANYQGIFFDVVGGGINGSNPTVLNANLGNGSYSDWSTGQKTLVKGISDYVKDPTKTGQAKPYYTTANIWNFSSSIKYNTFMQWYADGSLRFDHYYYEAGQLVGNQFVLGSEAPNGVVPNTTQAAYVNPSSPTTSYVPANLVSLDNGYGYVSGSGVPSSGYTKDGDFRQHLDALGTAGKNGAWFGWYGEDGLNLKYASGTYSGQYVFTNDKQLARAIPDWDNMAGVPVPNFGSSSVTDSRRWDAVNLIYQSSNSYASMDVLDSRNPLNGELYAVFRTLSGIIRLNPGEHVSTAFWTDDVFAKTGVSAMSQLSITLDPGGDYISLLDSSMLGTGLRFTTVLPEPGTLVMLFIATVLLPRRRVTA